MDLPLIEQLIRMMNMSTLSSLEIEEQGMRIRLENQTMTPGLLPSPPEAVSASRPLLLQQSATQAQEDALSVLEENCVYIKSPLVGTYHSTQALSYDPLTPGDSVSKGQAVCAVEAMKLMNVIEAEVAGEILEFMVEDGALVEYGQKLIKLRQS